MYLNKEKSMNKLTILEAMYEVIKDSTEWGVSEKEYGMFVDGVVAMTETMLEKEKERMKMFNNSYGFGTDKLDA